MRTSLSISRLWAWACGLALLLIVGVALAGTHRLTGTHLTRKSPAQVWTILTAYSDYCEKGCRYERPNLVRVKKLSQHETDTSWYTWSHVDNILRDVTYFSKVTVKWDREGGFSTDTLQLDASHQKLIDELEEKTGLKHRPAFDTANTTTTVAKNGGKTFVRQDVVLTASGVLDMWPAKIEQGIRDHMDATFKNIGP